MVDIVIGRETFVLPLESDLSRYASGEARINVKSTILIAQARRTCAELFDDKCSDIHALVRVSSHGWRRQNSALAYIASPRKGKLTLSRVGGVLTENSDDTPVIPQAKVAVTLPFLTVSEDTTGATIEFSIECLFPIDTHLCVAIVNTFSDFPLP